MQPSPYSWRQHYLIPVLAVREQPNPWNTSPNRSKAHSMRVKYRSGVGLLLLYLTIAHYVLRVWWDPTRHSAWHRWVQYHSNPLSHSDFLDYRPNYYSLSFPVRNSRHQAKLLHYPLAILAVPLAKMGAWLSQVCIYKVYAMRDPISGPFSTFEEDSRPSTFLLCVFT